MLTHTADKNNMQKVYNLGNCTKQTYNHAPLGCISALCCSHRLRDSVTLF